MHNFITRLHYESTVQLERYGHINYVTNIANAFLKYLLFVEEASMKARRAATRCSRKIFKIAGRKTGNSVSKPLRLPCLRGAFNTRKLSLGLIVYWPDITLLCP